MGEWTNGLFGCFSNCTTCIITYFVPCYIAGKNAEAVGENCLLHGVCTWLGGPIGIYFRAVIRGKIRETKAIEGSFINDCLCHWFCPLCALVQEATEMEGAGGQALEMARE